MDNISAAALKKWKTYQYRNSNLPFTAAVRSLVDENPLIEVRQSEMRKGDWVVCRSGTTAPANFVYAGVFSEADPYDTGNFVWGKEAADPRLDENRVARFAGFKAAYSYAIETYHNKDIWELQTILDLHMGGVEGFNSRSVKRREWQSGTTWHLRYYFRTPIFLTCEARGGQPEPPEGLHEWVVAAHRKSKTYRANPVRPSVCGSEGGRMRKIVDCTPNVLEYGDIVSVVFTLVYTEDREEWGPVPHLSHIVRVQRANRLAYRLTSSIVISSPAVEEGLLETGAVVDADQAATVDMQSAVNMERLAKSMDTRKGKGVDRSAVQREELSGHQMEVGAEVLEMRNVDGSQSAGAGAEAIGNRVSGADRAPLSETLRQDDGQVGGSAADGNGVVLETTRGKKRRRQTRSASVEGADEPECIRRSRGGGAGSIRRGNKLAK